MRPVTYALALLLLTGEGAAQQLSHPVTASRDDLFRTARPFLSMPDTVKVLAAMVQFQADDDDGTTGNGLFDLSSTSEPIIDAPPHNGQYFRDHLAFLENYFAKASDGKLILETTLIDTVYSLPNQMARYSPQRDEPNTKLAELARDAWQLVDASNKVSDFSSYESFVLFHAGVGRDIDLVSILGFDPSPRDIPSLYLGRNAFREAFGSDYPGILVNGGQDTIRNTAILPETESRLLPGVSGDVLLELSFNGLLCASVGSFLGLPDLFNTATGRSAIGRFGLMDGQAIFSFAGLFPPEPSAWEKYWVGWISPIRVSPGEQTVTLPAVGMATVDTVIQVPISAGEYFLLETRYRDPLANGQSVTTVYNGVTSTRTFPRDTIGFNAFDVTELAGVVVNVEDLDWSLPGGIDAQGVSLNGGVLIWHIDEAIIREKIATNGINADPGRRGVDLEEADGSQDIGEDYGFLSPGSGSEEGTPLDFWYAGNSSPVFQDEFSSVTFPASTSNEGANSHILINDFSASSPRMTARVKSGDDQIALLGNFPKSTGEFLPHPALTVGPLATSTQAILVATSGRGIPELTLEGDPIVAAGLSGKVFGWDVDGSATTGNTFTDGRLVEAMNLQGRTSFETSVAIRDLNGDFIPEIILAQGRAFDGVGTLGPTSTLRAFTPVDTNGDSLAESYFSIDVDRRITTPPVVNDSLIAFGAQGGLVYFINFDGTLADSVQFLGTTVDSIVGVSSLGPNEFVITGSDGSVQTTIRTSPMPVDVTFGIDVGSPLSGPAVTWSDEGGTRIALTTLDGKIYLVQPQSLAPSGSSAILPGFPVNTGDTCRFPPALADLDGDGRRDIVVFSGNTIHAYSRLGVSLDNFPRSVGSGEPISSAPIVSDVDGDRDLDVIAVTGGGLVVAYDAKGNSAAGFPLQAGVGNQSATVLEFPLPVLSTTGIALVVASSLDGSVTVWQTGTRILGPLNLNPWPQFQRDELHSGLATESITGPPISSQFFPTDRVYNWPNPVYDGATYIRFFVGENAAVNVKVFDLAGDLVAEMSGEATGGLDNEIPWDVSAVESGIYFARVEVSGAGGSGNAVIKVAVVK